MKITKENGTESPFQLIKTYVTKLNIENSFLNYDDRKPGSRVIDVSYNISLIDENESPDNRLSVVDLNIDADCEVDESLFHLSLSIRGIFLSDIHMDTDVLKKMLSVNGCASLYSIARGIVASTTAQIFARGTIILPLVNFVHFRSLVESDDSTKQ